MLPLCQKIMARRRRGNNRISAVAVESVSRMMAKSRMVSVSFFDIVADRGGSPQAHGGEERNGGRTLSGSHGHEPGPVLLKDAITGFAVLCQDGIQARLGGVGLMPTIKQADEIVTDLSDQVAMESDLGNLISMGHAGVGAAPVLAVGDGSVHLGFDLSHVRCCAVDFLKIQEMGALCHKSGQFSNRTPDQRWHWCWHRCDTSGSVDLRSGARSCRALPTAARSYRRCECCRSTGRRAHRIFSRRWVGLQTWFGCRWWYCITGRGDPSQFPDHLLHLLGIDGRVIPAHTVTRGFQMATDLPVSHAAHELLPGSLNAHLTVGHTCLSSVVEKLIVADPEGSVPGFEVGVTVHGGSFG